MIEVTHDALEEHPLHWNAWKGIMSVSAQRAYLALRREERTITIANFAREIAVGQTTVYSLLRQLEANAMITVDDDVESIVVLECPPTRMRIADTEDREILVDVWAECFHKRTEKTYQRGPGDSWQARKMPKGRSVAELSEHIKFYWAEMSDGKAQPFSYFVREVNSIIAYRAELERNLV